MPFCLSLLQLQENCSNISVTAQAYYFQLFSKCKSASHFTPDVHGCPAEHLPSINPVDVTAFKEIEEPLGGKYY